MSNPLSLAIIQDRQKSMIHRCGEKGAEFVPESTSATETKSAKPCSKKCVNCKGKTEASDKNNDDFEPEFDGDLESHSWVHKHLFDDKSGY